MAPMLASKQARQRFLGWLRSQRTRMLSHNGKDSDVTWRNLLDARRVSDRCAYPSGNASDQAVPSPATRRHPAVPSWFAGSDVDYHLGTGELRTVPVRVESGTAKIPPDELETR